MTTSRIAVAVDCRRDGRSGLVLIIVGAVLVGYAYWRQRQVLAIQVSGGVTFALNISKRRRVDDGIWYLHPERRKQTG
jgi:hypothetical protein